MKITLDANPPDAPCCIKLIADNGEDRLIQTDWDYPGIASSFGFCLSSVQLHGECGKVSTGLSNRLVKFCKHCERNTSEWVCSHSGTDGTVDCKECGVTASQFIQAARDWIDDNDGAEVEDPGYFAPNEDKI